ncbi:MAG: response regulator [Eubacteriales bacterium]
MSKKKIMVVDDNVTNLNIARKALEEDYEILLLLSGVKALKVLEKTKPDLILLDVEMPDMNGFEVIEQIKKMGHPYDEIPVIFVTAKDDSSSEYEGLDLGAVDYVIKPFSFPLLLKRVELHLKLAQQQQELQDYSLNLETMVDAKTATIQTLQYAIIHVLSDMVERRDGSTGGHLTRTTEYLKVLLTKAKAMDIYPEILKDVDVNVYGEASKLHDVGKISIPDSILLKDDRLNAIEYEYMKTHTTIGEDALRFAMESLEDSTFLEIAADFVGTHHEKWDGSGYPRGLKGEDIPIAGRLMAIADVYDALISRRAYKESFSHEKAVGIILEEDGSHFDPNLIQVFKEVHDDFYAISQKYYEEEDKKESKAYDL